MAYAFFTNPGLPSLASFGFGPAVESVVVETSDAHHAPEEEDKEQSPSSPSRSMSMGVMIKCNDCGGDVSLDQLTSHLCIKPNTILTTPPKISLLKSSSSSSSSSASSSMPPTLSTSSTTLSTSSTTTLSTTTSTTSNPSPNKTPSRSQIPFLEKYAQLVPTRNPSSSTPTTTTTTRPPLSRRDSSSDSVLAPLLKNNKPSKHVKLNKLLTPPTSPESNHFDQLAFITPTPLPTTSHLDAQTSNNPSSQSSPSTTGLDQLLATSHLIQSDLFNHLQPQDLIQPPPHHTPLQTPTRSSSRRSKSSRKSSQTPSSSNHQLEDLMGDLMQEMSRKAKQSTHKLKEKKAFSTTSPSPPHPNKHSRHNSNHHSTQFSPRIPSTTSLFDKSSPPPPDSPGIRPSDSISQIGFNRPLSPSPPPPSRHLFSSNSKNGHRCQRCAITIDPRHAKIRESSIPNTDTPPTLFCHSCYAELYLPKCRKCLRPIEKAAVTDRVGKVLGKYHPECFNCFQCSAPFPNGDFYVWERQPVCAKHYHRLAGTVCANRTCQRGIEGPCVSLSLDVAPTGNPSLVSSLMNGAPQLRRLYHPEHFTCTRLGCPNSLEEFHFVINGRPWCERHARQQQQQEAQKFMASSTDSSTRPLLLQSSSSPHNNNTLNSNQQTTMDYSPSSKPLDQNTTTMERRRTIIQNVRKR